MLRTSSRNFWIRERKGKESKAKHHKSNWKKRDLKRVGLGSIQDSAAAHAAVVALLWALVGTRWGPFWITLWILNTRKEDWDSFSLFASPCFALLSLRLKCNRFLFSFARSRLPERPVIQPTWKRRSRRFGPWVEWDCSHCCCPCWQMPLF